MNFIELGGLLSRQMNKIQVDDFKIIVFDPFYNFTDEISFNPVRFYN